MTQESLVVRAEEPVPRKGWSRLRPVCKFAGCLEGEFSSEARSSGDMLGSALQLPADSEPVAIEAASSHFHFSVERRLNLPPRVPEA